MLVTWPGSLSPTMHNAALAPAATLEKANGMPPPMMDDRTNRMPSPAAWPEAEA
jgi:hypothetical protein